MLAENQLKTVRDRVLFLRATPNLSEVDEHALTAMVEHSRVRRFDANEHLLEEGVSPPAAFLVVSGKVRVERQGRRVADVERNGGVGMLSIVARDPLGVSAIALAPTVALEIPAEVIIANQHSNFAIVSNAFRLLSRQALASRGNLPAPADPTRSLDVGTWRSEPLTLVQRLLLLRNTPFGLKNSLDALAELARSMHEVRVDEGDVLWRPGDPADRWLWIDYGRVSCEAPDGRRVEVASGYTIGLFDALGYLPRVYTARAETPLILQEVRILDHLAIIENYVPLAVELTAMLARMALE